MSAALAASVLAISEQPRSGHRRELATIYVATNGRCWIECLLHPSVHIHTEHSETDAVLWALDHLDDHHDARSLTLNLELVRKGQKEEK